MTRLRVVQVLPGSGDSFYCENCVRDNALVRSLEKAGQDVVAVPMYLPRVADPLEAAADVPVFYGGINAYLQQSSALFRWTPRWIDRIFDSKFLLKIAAKRAGSVRAKGLGEMTLSVLQGREGRQAKELERLVRWLESMEKPQITHLSSPLLLGIGAEIKRRLGTPIVCTLQDEDVWIDAMEEPWRSKCWETMAEGAKDVAAFHAVSRYFGDIMRDRLRIPPEKLHVAHVGLDAGPEPGEPAKAPAIGFLSRMSGKMGLGLLVDAWTILRKTVPGLRLHLSGGSTGDDKPFLDALRKRFADEGSAADVTFFDDLSPEPRRAFLSTLSVLSVPAPNGVAFGTYILEALAAGVPVVLPKLGSYPEIVEATGGGVLYAPNDAATLARELGALLADPGRRADLAKRGREAVVKSFSLASMAARMLEIYQGVLKA
ncbi:MAG TPA: glycosyltransferase family 4 protein [Planctomycetota bacterium]